MFTAWCAGYARWCLCFVVSYIIFHVELLNVLHVIVTSIFLNTKELFSSRWLDLCNIYLYDKTTIINMCYGASIQISSSFWMSVFCFVFIKIFYFCAFSCYLCLYVLFVLDNVSLFLSFSWSLLWSEWASWMVRRNNILKVITCMVTLWCGCRYWR